MQNKPNFGNDKMNINSFATSKYEILSALRVQKTNPIQTQLKPKQSQFKANKAKNKPNSNPILKGRPAWPYPACVSKRLTESCNGEKGKRNVLVVSIFAGRM